MITIKPLDEKYNDGKNQYSIFKVKVENTNIDILKGITYIIDRPNKHNNNKLPSPDFIKQTLTEQINNNEIEHIKRYIYSETDGDKYDKITYQELRRLDRKEKLKLIL